MPSEESQRLLRLFQQQEQLVKEAHQRARLPQDGVSARPEGRSDVPENTISRSNSKTAEELLLVDINLSLQENVDERLWNHAYYRRIEVLRRKVHRYRRNQESMTSKGKSCYSQLSDLLDEASGFYAWLVEHVRRQMNVPLHELGLKRLQGDTRKYNRLDSYANCIQQCYIYIGDLGRYRLDLFEDNTALSPNDFQYMWHEVETWYTQAAWCAPDRGKAYGQLSIVANSRGHWMDVIYWNCLSLATLKPSINARENLYAFYTKLKQNKITFESSNTDINSTFTESFILHHCTMIDTDTSTKAAALIAWSNVATPCLDQWLDGLVNGRGNSNSSNNNNNILKQQIPFKISAVCLTTIWYLQQDLMKSKDKVNDIRQSQQMACHFVIQLQTRLLDWMQQQWSKAAENKKDVVIRWLTSPLTASIVVWCDFCTSHTELMGQLAGHSKPASTRHQTQQKSMFEPFFQELVKWLKAVDISSDNSPVNSSALPEDWMLWGLQPLRAIQSKIDYASQYGKAPIVLAKARLARILHAAKIFATCNKFTEVEWVPQTGLQMRNERIKEKERWMQTLAAERLRDQVNSLQASLGEMHIDSRRRIAVVDTSVLLWHETLIRRWFQQRLCRVMVPLNVIEQLDDLKKGSQKENTAARDVIRMLDRALLRHDSAILTQDARHQLNHWQDAEPFMLASSETADAAATTIGNKHAPAENDVFATISKEIYATTHGAAENADTLIGDMAEPVIDYAQLATAATTTRPRSMEAIPRQHRPILGCCLWYLQEAGVKPQSSSEVRALLSASVVLVTDDSSLADYATWFGIQTATPQEWDTLVE